MSTQVTDDLIQKPKKVRKVMKVTNQETKLTTEQSSKCKCFIKIAFRDFFDSAYLTLSIFQYSVRSNLSFHENFVKIQTFSFFNFKLPDFTKNLNFNF